MNSKEIIREINKTVNRNRLIEAGLRNLKEFGYPDANEKNILNTKVYKAFFIRMLEDDENASIPGVAELLTELKQP